jgi:hypothetical protein
MRRKQGRESPQYTYVTTLYVRHHIIRTCPALARTRIQSLWQITLTDTDTWFIQGLLSMLTSPLVIRLEDSNRSGLPMPPLSPPQPAQY